MHESTHDLSGTCKRLFTSLFFNGVVPASGGGGDVSS